MFPEPAVPPLSVRGGIPRYVEDVPYAASFGEQWSAYRRVQLDSVTGRPLSCERLVSGTGWRLEELPGEQVLEVGCGAGRFTEVLLGAGAFVTAVDATSAVEACLANNGPHERLRVVQADLHSLPFRPGSFDRVFCYGVLQHTPDPRRAFLAVAEQARPGGLVAADVYAHVRRLRGLRVGRHTAKRLWRPLTTRLPQRLLRRLVEWYVPRWLPIDDRLVRVPKLGRLLTAVVPCLNYRGVLDLPEDQLEAWAVLDTFDALASRYDKPQALETVRAWCAEAGLAGAEVRQGGNGILINARRPAAL